MKKLFPLFFILLSLGTLSAQNLNFKDTNGLKALLCGRAWICYGLNPDSTFSEKVMDSIKFYPNRTLYISSRPKDDSTDELLLPVPLRGNWSFGSTARAARTDTATNCININMPSTAFGNTHGIGYYVYALVDGHRIKGTKRGKIIGNLDEPFLVSSGINASIYWDRHYVWQQPRQLKKEKIPKISK